MKEPPAYQPDPEHAIAGSQVAFLFHVLVGADPIGDFQAVENVSYAMQPYAWSEGGRNHSPRLFPFEAPARGGEVTLRWGMLLRSALYDWMRAVRVGRGFRRDVTILQLNRQKIPLRLMRLRQAWPTAWHGADLSSTETSFAVEHVTLVYEDMQLVSNLSLLAVPSRVSSEEPSPIEASDYQAEQERLDALLESAEAEREAREAEAAALAEERAEAEAALEAERLRGQKARERRAAAAESAAAEHRTSWEGARADAAAATPDGDGAPAEDDAADEDTTDAPTGEE